MRHSKRTFKLGRTRSHLRCMVANMLKSLIQHGRVETTLAKAKNLKRYADRMITLAKRDTLASRRQAMAELMVQYNTLSFKEKRQARAGNISAYNWDRQVIRKLFGELGPRYIDRSGGYTRIVRTGQSRHGDNAELCFLEYLS